MRSIVRFIGHVATPVVSGGPPPARHGFQVIFQAAGECKDAIA